MLDWYTDLPSAFRKVVATIVLLVGLALAVTGWYDRPQYHDETQPDGRLLRVEEGGTYGGALLFRWGVIATGIGVVMVLLAGKSRAEQNGYNF